MRRLFLEADELGQWTRQHGIHERWADHGLGLLVTLAKQRGYDFDIWSLKEMHSWAEYRLRVKPYDLICMNVRSWRYNWAQRAAEIAKKANPNVQVWVGGFHATVAPEEMLEVPEFDVIVSRQAEGTFLKLLEEGGSKERFLEGDVGAYTNLDDLPWVDRTLWPRPPMSELSWPLEAECGWGPGPKVATMITGRMCPWKCLAEGTPILMADLTWRPIESIQLGDQVVGLWKKAYGHYLAPSIVSLVFPRRLAKSYQLITDRGTVVTTEDHPWLSHRNHSRWRITKRLRAGDKIRWLTNLYESPNIDSVEYKRGYIAGAIAGDGSIGHYNRKPPRNPETKIHRFGLVGDDEMLDTVLLYCHELGIAVEDKPFNGGKLYPGVCRIIRSCAKDIVDQLERLRDKESDHPEFQIGFMAGAFDADGTRSRYTLRFCNLDPKLIEQFGKYLTAFKFTWKYEARKNGQLCGLRLLGGCKTTLRFLGMVQPKVQHRRNISNLTLGMDYATVLEVIPSGEIFVYNLSTASQTYIASGLASHNCSFCYPAELNHFQKLRRRSVGNVIGELNWIEEKWGPIGSVVFHDSEFLMQRPWLEEFIERYPRETKRWPFWASARADMICQWPDLVEAMVRQANWHTLSVGFESGSDRVLKLLNKGTTRAQNDQAIELINRIGDDLLKEGKMPTVIYANIMLAIPGEEREDAFETIRMAGQVKRSIPSMAFYSPYPGHVISDRLRAEGKSLDRGKDYMRFPDKPKVAGVDYQFYWDLLNGKYDHITGVSARKLVLDQGHSGLEGIK